MTLPNYGSPRISSELPDCSSPLTMDIYNKCSMHCTYCFSKSQKGVNPVLQNVGLQGVNPSKFFAAVDGKNKLREPWRYYKFFYKNKFLLHIGGLADSFCYFERKYGNAYEIIKGLLARGYPINFSTKGPVLCSDKFLQLFEKYKKKNTLAFQFSIVTADDELAKRVEVGVPSPTERFEYMKILSDMGFHTVLRLRPFIMGVSDPTLPQLMQKAYEAGAKAVSTEFYAVDLRCVGDMKKDTFKLGRIMGTDNIFKYYGDLSPKERGGYLRMNRLVKEPYIKYMYKFCLDHNMIFACSDPDFKELCMTQNCCGMPPKGMHPTRVMNNWSVHQLTAALMEARIQYHKTGECALLKFSKVYEPTDWIFDDTVLSHVDIGCTKFPYAVRKQLTLRHILQDKWNNLNSPANVRNYFHGKLMPVGLDDDGDLVYKYNPLEYEKRWVDEGIDLSYDWREHNAQN